MTISAPSSISRWLCHCNSDVSNIESSNIVCPSRFSRVTTTSYSQMECSPIATCHHSHMTSITSQIQIIPCSLEAPQPSLGSGLRCMSQFFSRTICFCFFSPHPRWGEAAPTTGGGLALMQTHRPPFDSIQLDSTLLDRHWNR